MANLEQLKAKPFFYKGVSDADELFTTGGSNYAQSNQNRLLAEMIPALSNAAGANPISKFDPPSGNNNNINMTIMFKNGWPSGRDNGDWLHSDLKTVAYPFIYLLYDEVVELGGLNQ